MYICADLRIKEEPLIPPSFFFFRLRFKHDEVACDCHVRHLSPVYIRQRHLCCSVLQCIAVYCSVSTYVSDTCVAVCCSVLQCVAVCLHTSATPVLQCVAVYCIVLLCVAACCSVLTYVSDTCVAVCCSVLQCVALCCGV